MEVGKLYKTKKLHWLLYRSQDAVNITLPCVDRYEVAFWTTHNHTLPFIPPNSFFVLLEKKQNYCKVLSHEGNIGWIYLAEWCKNDIEELVLERLNENSY